MIQEKDLASEGRKLTDHFTKYWESHNRANLTDPFRSDYAYCRNWEPKKGYFRYINAGATSIYPIFLAKQLFKETYGREAETFLDFGCGLGGTLITAKHLGLKATGIEYTKRYINAAKKIFADNPKYCDGIKLLHRDIFSYKRLAKSYDIVYFWDPIIDHKLCGQLYRHIASLLPIGQVIVSFGGDLKHRGFDVTAPLINSAIGILNSRAYTGRY